MKTSVPDAEVLLKYGKSNGWLDNQPAVITRPFGKGSITYIGAVLDDKLMASAAQWMVQQSGVTPIFGPVPDGVEVSRRNGDGRNVFVLINFAAESRTVALPHFMKLLLANTESSSVELPQYGVEILVDSK